MLSLEQNDNFSKCVIWGTSSEFFDFLGKLCSVLKTFKILYFLPSHDLRNLWRHDEYYYLRQGAFLNTSFEPQLIDSPNLAS